MNETLINVKLSLPFTFRYEVTNAKRWKAGHPDYNDKSVIVPRAKLSAIEAMRLFTANLPGWQATAFPSHMILYQENREYRSGQKIFGLIADRRVS